MKNLSEKKVAILATHGFEESELLSPKKALETAGVEAHIISPESGEIKAWNRGNWSNTIPVDRVLHHANESDYDALVLPGGVLNPDKLRREQEAVDFTKSFFEAHKPVAAICHGPQLLIDAEVVDGRTVTSFPAIRKDVENAGAEWVDQEVVVDSGLVTSRKPDDLDAFNYKMLEEIAEGKHTRQTA